MKAVASICAVLLLGTVHVKAQTSTTQWWILSKGTWESSFNNNAFTICEVAGFSPAYVYERLRDEGNFPTIKVLEGRVDVSFNEVEKGDSITNSYHFFRTKDSCEKEAQVRRLKAQADKDSLKDFR